MKRRVIIHPKPRKGSDLPFPLRRPPFLHIDVYLWICWEDQYKETAWQTYTFGEYGSGSKKWLWRGVCRCGVNYLDSSPAVVNSKMKEHVRMAGHEPGTVYTVSGQAAHLESRRLRDSSKRSSSSSSTGRSRR